MTYTLNFSLNLERQGSSIIYNSEEFVEKPIFISVPDVVKILEHWIEGFEQVGVIEMSQRQTEFSKGASPLVGLSAKAYICKSQDLNDKELSQLCIEITEYLQNRCSVISSENILSEEVGLYISGLREIIELRNYLTRYINSRKKMYQNGYVYIMSV
jgi:hypothetical protein